MRYSLLALLLACGLAQAEVQTRSLDYQSEDGTRLVGYYAYDDATDAARPGVLVVHEWWGLNDYAKERARQLAALGYSALAIDMYGAGKTADHPKDALAFMQEATRDADAARARFVAGMDLLRQQPQTDATRIAALGYCFGGRVVLDMARQGVPLAAVASLHGALGTTTPAVPGSVKARVLVEHGALDSMVPPADVAAFTAEMVTAGADLQFVSLPGAKHSFSNPDADQHQGHGLDIAYSREADERSWADVQRFFAESFAHPQAD